MKRRTRGPDFPLLGERLRLLEEEWRGRRLDSDPLELPHRYAAPADREVVAFLAASLAFGRVGSIRGSAERLLAADDFSAFRPFGKETGPAPAKKGPKGEAAFFPLLGLLAAEVRRMLALKAALAEPGAEPGPRRADYRAFVDRLLPRLKAARPGAAPVPIDGHPFVLHKAYLASFDWSIEELAGALAGLAEVDRGVKTGVGSGPELLQTWLLGLHRSP